MSIVDRFFVGTVIKDFGVIKEKSFGVGKSSTSALLVEKKGELYFAIKESSRAILSASVRYISFDIETAKILGQMIKESEIIARR